MEVWSSGALQARYSGAAVEAWRYGLLELSMLSMRDAGVAARGVPEERCRYADVEVSRHRALEASYRRSGVRVWSDGDLEARCRSGDTEVGLDVSRSGGVRTWR